MHLNDCRHHSTSLHESRLKQWGYSLWSWCYYVSVIQSLVCQDPEDERRSWPSSVLKALLGVVSCFNILLLALYIIYLTDLPGHKFTIVGIFLATVTPQRLFVERSRLGQQAAFAVPLFAVVKHSCSGGQYWPGKWLWPVKNNIMFYLFNEYG